MIDRFWHEYGASPEETFALTHAQQASLLEAMTERKQQEIELEAALHGVKLPKRPTLRPIRPKTTNLDRQLAAGKLKGYRIRTGVRGQPQKRAQ